MGLILCEVVKQALKIFFEDYFTPTSTFNWNVILTQRDKLQAGLNYGNMFQHVWCQTICQYMCPSFCQSICSSVYSSVCPSVHPSVSKYVCPIICHSVHLFVCLSICLPICLYICLLHILGNNHLLKILFFTFLDFFAA